MQRTRKTHLHPHVGHARRNWVPRLSLRHEIQVLRRSRILSLRPLTIKIIQLCSLERIHREILTLVFILQQILISIFIDLCNDQLKVVFNGRKATDCGHAIIVTGR